MKFMTLFLFILIVMIDGLPALAMQGDVKAFTDFAREQGVALALLSALVINYIFFEAPRRNKAEMALVAAQTGLADATRILTETVHKMSEIVRVLSERVGDCPHRK